MSISISDICMAISAYQCYPELKRCIDSIPEEIFILLYDGKYTYDDKPQGYSTDGTASILKDLGRRGFAYSYSGTQIDKRQLMADKAAELGFKIMLIIDSDEYIHRDYSYWPGLIDELNKYCPKYPDGMVFDMYLYANPDYDVGENVLEIDNDGFIHRPTIWYLPEKLEYYGGIHWWVRRKNSTNKAEKLNNIVIVNKSVVKDMDSLLRTPEFMKERKERQLVQVDHENRIHGI
jgi:hypothetical protein